MLLHFADKAHGGFFFTADDHERLIARQKDLQDSSVPSGQLDGRHRPVCGSARSVGGPGL